MTRIDGEIWLAAGVRTPFAKVDGPLASFDAIIEDFANLFAVNDVLPGAAANRRGLSRRPGRRRRRLSGIIP